VSYSEEQICQFLKQGEKKEKQGLRWWGRDSFFDSDVQSVLMKRHPSHTKYSDDLSKRYPVRAWEIVDSLVHHFSIESWVELSGSMERDPLWISELLVALNRYIEHQSYIFNNGTDDTLEQIRLWRGNRSIAEAIGNDHATVVKVKTLAKHNLTPDDLKRLGAPPLTVIEKPNPAKSYMDGRRRASPEAYRQAAKRENDRRDGIMRLWAESWLARQCKISA
jgi:hypothetical protein